MDAKCQVPADSVHKLPKINASGTRQACFLKLELRAFASATKLEATSKGLGTPLQRLVGEIFLNFVR